MTPIWKKIDPENLPKVEVVAMNEDLIKHKYIGVIEIVNGHICTDEQMEDLMGVKHQKV